MGKTARRNKLLRAQLATGDALVITRLCQFARPIIMQHSNQRTNCIAATRIVIETLAHFSIAAEPLACRAIVRNATGVRLVDSWLRYNAPSVAPPQMILDAWRERGEWSIGFGFGGLTERGEARGFNGHVVARVPSLLLVLDASIDAADRPEKRMGPMPGVLRVPWDGQGETRAIDVDGNGTCVEYEAFESRKFEQAPDWLADVSDDVNELVGRIDPVKALRR